MNGGRLSDDEALARGLQMVRARVQDRARARAQSPAAAGGEPSGGAAAQAAAEADADAPPLQGLRMIAMRYPEEAEAIESLWRGKPGVGGEQIERLLAQIETQFAEDCADADA